jgi:hypothetical protein
MDNFLEIGARVILEGLTAGMDQATTVVEESTSTISDVFASMTAAVTGSGAKIIETFHEIGVGSQEMAEHFVESAEVAKISADGIGSAFGGVATLLGGGLIAGFAASFINETEKSVLELGHLSEKTGIAIV